VRDFLSVHPSRGFDCSLMKQVKRLMQRMMFATVLGSVALLACADPLYDTTNVVKVAYGDEIKVDGDLTKAVWKDVPSVGAFTLKGTEETPEPYATEVKLRYSKTALYIGGSLSQPMDQLVAQFDQNDLDLWKDDNLEMFLVVPAENGPQVCHFVVNALGSVYDAKEGKKSWWVPGRWIAAKRLSDRWTFELKLPYRGLGIERPFAGDALGVRFCRTVHNPKTAVSTAPHMTGAEGHHVRKYFAKLSFEPPQGAGAAVLAAEAEAYRKKAVAKRFATLSEETETMLAGLEASVPLFKAKKSPVYAAAETEIAKMRAAYEDFKKQEGEIAVRLEALKTLSDGFRATATTTASSGRATDAR